MVGIWSKIRKEVPSGGRKDEGSMDVESGDDGRK
jgi:hypothetical protein